MNQNLRGEMKPKLVMPVRSHAAGFWRVLAFDSYTGKGWRISRNDQVTTLRQSPWTSRISIDSPPFITLTKEVVQTYNLVSEMPNLIPAMSYPKGLYFPTPAIAVDQEDGLRAPVQLSEGLTYTVVSDVPYRDRSLLSKASTKYPGNIKKYAQFSSQHHSPEIAEVIDEICHAYVSWRYGGHTPNWQQLQQRWQVLKKVERNRVS